MPEGKAAEQLADGAASSVAAGDAGSERHERQDSKPGGRIGHSPEGTEALNVR
jgi:hypothetical protein